MPRILETAVAAACTRTMRMQFVRALSLAGIQLLAMPRDGLDAFKALEDFRPDLLLCDVELPVMEGTALLLRALGTSRLSVRPAAILVHESRFALPARKELEDLGVHLLERPLQPQTFCKTIDALKSDPPTFLPGDLHRIDQILDELGVPEHVGRDCLKIAALLCAADERYLHQLHKRLYPRTGELCGLNAAQVERAMRHAINLAWQSDKIDNQYRIFAGAVDAGRGQPVCSEMISRLADILRLEG